MESGSDCRELEDRFNSSRLSSPATESGIHCKSKALSMRQQKKWKTWFSSETIQQQKKAKHFLCEVGDDNHGHLFI